MFSRRRFLELGTGALAAAGAGLGSSAPPLTPDQVHKELMEGNRRFVSGHARHPHASLSWVKRAAKGQHPHAVILCCSDSRVSPEILFDQGLGDLFVVRVAGNVANDDEIGSIEYAVEHLHVPLCVVLGHTGCGAVSAVVAGDALPQEIEHLVAPIRLAHSKAKALYPDLSGQDLIQPTVRLNVLETSALISKGPKVLEESIRNDRFRVEGAVYNLETGKVDWNLS
jgi:carbonic anhydrase